MSDFTDRVDLELKKRRIGKYDFYDQVGITATAYSKWARGINEPSMKMGNFYAEKQEANENANEVKKT